MVVDENCNWTHTQHLSCRFILSPEIADRKLIKNSIEWIVVEDTLNLFHRNKWCAKNTWTQDSLTDFPLTKQRFESSTNWQAWKHWDNYLQVVQGLKWVCSRSSAIWLKKDQTIFRTFISECEACYLTPSHKKMSTTFISFGFFVCFYTNFCAFVQCFFILSFI